MLTLTQEFNTVDPPRAGADLLAFGFGTTAAMWAVWWLSHQPFLTIPPMIGFFLLALAVLGCGVLLGAMTQRGPLAPIIVGLITGSLNLLVLYSVIADEAAREFMPPVHIWLPGFYLLTIILLYIGFFIGKTKRDRWRYRGSWTGAFAGVAVLTTIILIISGGMVTGFQAGLAVPDWPNTFGSNMFAYAFTMMTSQRGVYYEHTHRLLGSLVGLTTVVLALHLFIADRRGLIKILGIVAVIFVIIQGVMGGLRVSQAEELLGLSSASTAELVGRGIEESRAEHESPLSLALRIIHGVTGQLFLAFLVMLTVMLSRRFRDGQPAQITSTARFDRYLGVGLFLVLLVQLVFGALIRHMPEDGFYLALFPHIGMAMIVLTLALIAGLRAWFSHGQFPPLRRIGRLLVILICLQVILGFAALIVRGEGYTALRAVTTTIHQGTGAVILLLAVALTTWQFRLFRPSPRCAHEPDHSIAESKKITSRPPAQATI